MTGVIVHDWIERNGGAEFVLSEMNAALRPRHIYATWNDDLARFSEEQVVESWVARTPLRGRKAAAVPFLPDLWRNLPADGIEWMLVSSHAFAHHAKVSGRTVPKFGYIHSPARYLWFPEVDGRGSNPLVRLAGTVLKPLDRRRAREMDAIVANSAYVASRIQRVWGMDAGVIYPPVDVEYFGRPQELAQADAQTLTQLPSDFILGASRFVPYKRLDVAIRLGKLSGRPVVIAGNGPGRQYLEDMAARSGAEVHFVIEPSRPLLAALFRSAALLSFPVLEDFGIVPVEAMASGTPVVGLDRGGVAESVIHGETGWLVRSPDDEDELRNAVAAVEKLAGDSCERRAQEFSRQRFAREIREFVGLRSD